MPSAVPVMHAAVPGMHAGVALKRLAVPSGCEHKSGIQATIRGCSRGRSLALRVAVELAQPRQAVVFALQAVSIIVGISRLSGCRQCRQCKAGNRRGSNELEHFIFLLLAAIHGTLPWLLFFERAGLPRECGISKAAPVGGHKAVCSAAQHLIPERAARRFVRSRPAVRRRPRAGSRRGLAGAANRLRHSVRNPWRARYSRPAARHSRSRYRPR
jgi:hypothetical protein